MRSARFILAIAFALLATAFVGCDDDDSPSNPGGANPAEITIEIAEGSSVPGCEEDNTCYSPHEASIRPGGEVSWFNADATAHTITSGTPGDGPTGAFDSSLLLAGRTYTIELETAGTYPYFCMVHPWMTGTIIVE